MNSPLMIQSSDSRLMHVQVESATIYTFGAFTHTIPDALSMMTPTDEEIEEWDEEQIDDLT